MPKNITTLKIQRNGTLKVARGYDATTLTSGKPGRVGQIDADTNEIILAPGVASNVVKGLIVEETTINEDQNKISLLTDEAEVYADNGALASGVHFTIGCKVYHTSAGLLTPTSGTGNQVGTSLADIYSNSGSDLDLLTRSAVDIAKD